jgi:phage baseplate assembly protein W
VQTLRGELPLALTYGIPDPTFTEVSDTEIAAALTLFNPEVEVSSIEAYLTSDGKSVIDIDFVETDNAVA